MIFNIGVQQVQTSSCIAVDPAFVIIFTQSHAALPKFVLDKRVRQQIVPKDEAEEDAGKTSRPGRVSGMASSFFLR